MRDESLLSWAIMPSRRRESNRADDDCQSRPDRRVSLTRTRTLLDAIGAQLETVRVPWNRCDYLDPARAGRAAKTPGRARAFSELGYQALTRPKSSTT